MTRRVLKLLLQHLADPNIVGGRYNTALHAASYRGWLANVRLLLEHNADPNLRDGEGRTVLWAALNSGRPDIATVLLAHGAEPENMSVNSK
ncbi:ankyrin repeat-containing domain protein [Mycena rebaudengoi]|nr:ankyrin repeat-containing domain protein [Mycena rebaudengoi]